MTFISCYDSTPVCGLASRFFFTVDGESPHVFSDMRFRLKEQSPPDTGCSFVAQAKDRGLVEMYDASSASGWNWNSTDFLLVKVRHMTKLS